MSDYGGTKTIDRKVVEMRFDNSNFERNVRVSMGTLDKLREKLNLPGATKGLEEVQKTANGISFKNIETSLDALTKRFSTKGIAGIAIVENTIKSLLQRTGMLFDYFNRLSRFTINGIVQGGLNRARNLEEARFQLQGLLNDAEKVNDVMRDVDYGVSDTAYSLDAAAKVAAQLAASGMEAGVGMRTALRGISGVAAMTNSTYEDIGRIFTTVAGNGRLMGEQLLQLSTRGMNAAATLGKYLGKSEAEVRDMVSKGKISFEMFAKAMDDAFGEHAKDANKTLTGTMSNIRSALAKIGAEFINPIIANEGPLVGFLNAVREKINEIKSHLIPLAHAVTPKIAEALVKWTDSVKNIDLTKFGKFIEKLINFINNYKANEKSLQNIKDILGGIGAVLSVIFTIIKNVLMLVGRLLKAFSPIGKGFVEVSAAAGRFLSKTGESIKKSTVFADVLNKVSKGLKYVTDKVKEFVKETLKMDSVTNFLKGMFTGITKLATALGKIFVDILRNGDLKKTIEAINTGLLGGFLIQLNKWIKGTRKGKGEIEKFMDSVRGVIDAGAGILNNIKNILVEVKNVLVAWQRDINAKTLLKIAAAIAIITASLYTLSAIDEDRLGASLGAMALMLGEMVALFAAFKKLSKKDINNVTKSTVMLIGISISMLILSKAIKRLSTISSEQMFVGIFGMIFGMYALISAFNAIPNPEDKNSKNKTKGLIKLSLALYVMALAIKKMGSMSLGDLLKGLLGMTVGLSAIVIALNKMDPDKAGKKALSLLVVSNAMLILGASLKILGSMSWSEIGRGLVAMGGALAILTIAMNALATSNKQASALGIVSGSGFTSANSRSKQGGAIGKSFALLGATTSLIILGGALKILGSMSWSDIGRSLTVMAGSLAILIIALKIIGSDAKTAAIGVVSLLGIASALVVLGLGMKILGSLSWDSITRGLVALGGALLIIGAAGALLSGVLPAILGVAAAAALIGVAAVALGVGLGLIATGISALALALSGGATAIVAGLGAIILGIAELIPQLIDIAGESISKIIKNVLIKIVKDCLPIITDTLIKGVYNILKVLAQYTPKIVDAIMDVLIGLLRAVAVRVPELVIAAVELLDMFFKGIIEALEILDPKVLLTGIAALGLLSAVMYLLAGLVAIAPMAVIGILAFGVLISELALVLGAVGKLAELPGLKVLVDNGGDLLLSVGTAIGKFVGGIVGGFGAGVSNSLPLIGTNLSKFMKNIQGFITGLNSVSWDSTAKVMILSGAITLLSTSGLITTLMNILSFGSGLPGLGTQLSKFMKNVDGFIKGANGISPTLLGGVDALTKSIILITAANVINGISSWLLGGKSFEKFGKNISTLGTSMKEFATNLGTFSDTQMNSIKVACAAIIELAKAFDKIPNEGGMISWFIGDNTIDKFSKHLPDFGTNMKNFVSNLGTFTNKQVGSISCASSALVELAKAANKIPNEGGMWSWLVGDNTLGHFSTYLPELGKNLGDFAKKLGTFTNKQVETVKCATLAITELATAASKIPNSGGLKALFEGDNDISKFISKLPNVATHLNSFVNNSKSLDSKAIDKAVNVAKILTELSTAASKIPKTGGLKTIFSGDADITKFIDKLPTVGEFLSSFVDSVSDFEATDVEVANTAANILATFATAASKIPKTGYSISALFSGITDIQGFADSMPELATGITNFISNLGEDITPEKINLVDSAAKIIATLAKASKDIPAEGLSFDKFINGTKDIKSFSEKFPVLGTGIAGFIKNLGDKFTEDKIPIVESAAKVISILAKAAAKIPDEKFSFSKLLGGDSDLKKFADNLPILGTGISKFVSKLGKLDKSSVETVEISTKLIKALVSLTKIDSENTGDILDKLSSKLGKFATSLSSFITKTGKIDKDTVEAAVSNVKSILELIKEITKINKDAFDNFRKSLKKMGEKGFKELVDAFSGEEPKLKVARAIRDLLDKMIASAEVRRNDLTDKFKALAEASISALTSKPIMDKAESAGKSFAQGFANGITNNVVLSANAGTTLGNAAYNAAKKAIDAHSPSKKAHKLGNFFGLGFVNGISEYSELAYDESKLMANKATKGLMWAISTIQNMLDDNMDINPIITPIVDLSEIESNSDAISKMFGNVDINGNVTAINRSMNRNRQNGNEDVVSAINKLSSTLNGNGDTYNINGISYNNDSDVADAVRTLVRAIQIERRV